MIVVDGHRQRHDDDIDGSIDRESLLLLLVLAVVKESKAIARAQAKVLTSC